MWVLSLSWCNGASPPGPPPERPSGSQHPRPQQVEPSPPVALPLEQLELVDEPLHRPVAPGFRQPGPHRVEVLLEPRGEAPHRESLARLGLFEPPVELLAFEVPDRAVELLGQPPGVGERLFRYSFCSLFNFSSLRMNNAATFFEVGDSPARAALPRAGHGRGRLAPGLGTPELGREAGADLFAVSVASLADLAVELLAIVTALVPSPDEVGDVGVEDALLPLVRPAWRRLGEVLVAVDGPGAYAEPLTDVPEIRPGEVEAANVPPLLDQALVALPRGLLDLPVVGPRSVRHDGSGAEGFVAPVFGLGPRRGRLAEGGLLLEQEALEHVREVVQEVPAVRDLHGARGARGALGQRFAVDVGAVAGGELYLGMPPQPGEEALLRAFGQQVHHPPLLEVHEDRAVCVPPPEGEVVHAEHLGFAGARQRGTLRHPEQDVPADHEPELRGKPGAGAPAQPQHDREQGLLQPLRLAGASKASSGSLSQKILLWQEVSSQKKRRTRTSSFTETPCQGKSETVRR